MITGNCLKIQFPGIPFYPGMTDYSGRTYAAAIARSHANIGRALFYTTLTITLGFSILALSSFVPTLYFGLLTGFAMLTALAADLTLLPLLLARFQAFGKPASAQTA